MKCTCGAVGRDGESSVDFYLRKKVRNERIRCNLSQKALASMMSVHNTTIAKIERGDRKVTVVELDEMARIFGLSTDALLGRNG
jgi:transcriptional regulator with XRE-family HTH domain